MKLPDSFVESLIEQHGPEIKVVVDEINSFAAKQIPRLQSTLALSSPFSDLAFMAGNGSDGKVMRPGDKLTYDRIEKMKKCGPVMFALWMKMSPIIRVFGSGRYKLDSPDKELVDVTFAASKTVMPKMVTDLVYNMFTDGTSFQIKRFEQKNKYQLGLSNSRSSSQTFVVPKVPESIAAYRVRYINETKDGNFNGFTIRGKPGKDDRRVPAEEALVTPMWGGWNGSLWGDPFLAPMYPLWVWYEIAMRAMARHMEVVAKHIFIVRAPSQGTTEVNGEEHSNMDVGLAMATSLAKSNALAIPSDRYRQGEGELMWDVQEYKAESKESMFIGFLNWICNQMIRTALNVDASLQSGDNAGYNIGIVHERASSVSTEIILMLVLHSLNRYWFPDFSLYNRGINGPPLLATTQPIDLLERELLMKILNIAGNSEAGVDFFNMVDWRGLSDIANVPILTETEVKKRLKQKEEEAKRRMEEFIQQQKDDPAGDNQEGNDNGDGSTETKNQVFRKAAELMIQSGKKLPLFLSHSDMGGLPVKITER